MFKIDKFRGEGVYALVDAILISNFLKNWLKLNPNLKVYNLFESTINSHIDYFSSPLLINITNLSLKEIENLVNKVDEIFPVISIFSTNLEESILLKKLKFMMFPLIQGEMKFFRFYDPLYFSNLKLIFNDLKCYEYFLDIFCLVDSLDSFERKHKLIRVI